MLPLYPLVKCHLQLAKDAITGRDERANELRRIIDLTIKLLERSDQRAGSASTNVIDFCEARRRRDEK
jgi:hypothetical protein